MTLRLRSARRRWPVLLLAAAVGIVPFFGPGALKAQDDETVTWTWVTGLIDIPQASTVAMAAYNEGTESATYKLEIMRFVPSQAVFEVGPGTLGPGSRASTSGPICGPGQACPSQVVIRLHSNSPTVIPSGRILPTGGTSHPEFLTAGDFTLVSPRGGDAAASVEAAHGVEAMRTQLMRTREVLQRRVRRISRNQKTILRRLKRIQNALR